MTSEKPVAPEEQATRPQYQFSREDITITHAGIPEIIHMNKYHLILVMDRLKKGSKVPSYADVWPWVGTFLAFLLVLITADTKRFLGLSADSWTAIFVFATFISLFLIICTIVKAFTCRKERVKTPEQEVEDIIEQMESDRKKLPS